MNVILWILQILLAIHTLIGAVWKFFNSAAILPFANPIPASLWPLISVIEILCSLALVIPFFKKSLGYLVPAAALLIATEMILFSLLLVNAEHQDYVPLVYWLVAAAFCVIIAVGRRFLKPIR